jgi:hypothetical protein
MKGEVQMRKILIAAVAVGAMCGLAGSHQASAAPVQPGLHPAITAPSDAAPIVKADWYWGHRHWHHRRWYHHGWRYYD